MENPLPGSRFKNWPSRTSKKVKTKVKVKAEAKGQAFCWAENGLEEGGSNAHL
jgi:hypothetical protein